MGSLTMHPIIPSKPRLSCNASNKLQTKEVQVSNNGVITITPDFGYDGLSSIKIIINVPTSEENVEVITLDESKLDETRLM